MSAKDTCSNEHLDNLKFLNSIISQLTSQELLKLEACVNNPVVNFKDDALAIKNLRCKYDSRYAVLIAKISRASQLASDIKEAQLQVAILEQDMEYDEPFEIEELEQVGEVMRWESRK